MLNINNSYRLSDSCGFWDKCIHKYLILVPSEVWDKRYDFYVMPCEETDIYITDDFIRKIIAARFMPDKKRKREIETLCREIYLSDPWAITDEKIGFTTFLDLDIPWEEWEKIALAFGIEHV